MEYIFRKIVFVTKSEKIQIYFKTSLGEFLGEFNLYLLNNKLIFLKRKQKYNMKEEEIL
jgi:hypothetical protein